MNLNTLIKAAEGRHRRRGLPIDQPVTPASIRRLESIAGDAEWRLLNAARELDAQWHKNAARQFQVDVTEDDEAVAVAGYAVAETIMNLLSWSVEVGLPIQEILQAIKDDPNNFLNHAEVMKVIEEEYTIWFMEASRIAPFDLDEDVAL